MAADEIDPTAERIFDVLKAIIARDFRLRKEDLTPSASLEALDLDSIDAVDIAVSLEEEIGFQFQSEHLERIHTLQDVVDVVVSGMASRSE